MIGVTQELQSDVIIAGGGPAGSVLAWDLARRGVHVVLLERSRFPREKVCGDFVDPRGLLILQAMGCLDRLERSESLPITRTATFVDWERHYSGPIPFYGLIDRLPAHGYTIPREELDAVMLDAARAAGAIVHEETAVTEVRAGSAGVEVVAERASRTVRYGASLIAGADGVNSVVARSQGLLMNDASRTAVARRAYAVVEQGVDGVGEAEIFYDESTFPGYGWMFPGCDGRVNLGVGLLSEARSRFDVSLPAVFTTFVEGLRRHHPRCSGIELVSSPIGGIVKMYGGAGRNHFDGGVLVGDAGSFVDPMTGEGITPGMESALLAAATFLSALETGEFHAGKLAEYEAGFRSYFDPSMVFLDFCAGMLRNRHLARPWLRALARGCQVAQTDEGFARTSGSYFGGLEIRPFDILGQVWLRSIEDVLLAWPRLLSGGDRRRPGTSPADLIEWQTAMSRSLLRDPVWHVRWMLDMQRQWTKLLETAAGATRDPRADGLLQS
ncbi:MAG TPA: NAD(P)/FAD-dependent oxidoreductase [Solirubrobacteraceae bacterium]|nr:NAD(P)/FAD-dependent oxidoreductase [Solirubrobacteraceae bacterium]